MNRKSFPLLLGLLIVALLSAACSTSTPVVSAEERTAPPSYTVAATESELILPEAVPGGIVELHYTNESEIRHMLILARLDGDLTPEQYDAALAGPDPMAAYTMVHWLGGTALMPGQESAITYDLSAGQHVMVDFGDGPPRAFYFTVTDERSAAAAPVAVVETELKDFALILPDTIPTGRQLWQITNNGDQWHEIQLVKLNEGATVQDAMDFMAQGPVPVGTPPFELISFIAPLNPGETIWTAMDLAPGEYTLICALPDLLGGHGEHTTHAHRGMVRQLTVTE